MTSVETETKPIRADSSTNDDLDLEYYLFEVSRNDHLENQIQRLMEMEQYFQQQSKRFEPI